MDLSSQITVVTNVVHMVKTTFNFFPHTGPKSIIAAVLEMVLMRRAQYVVDLFKLCLRDCNQGLLGFQKILKYTSDLKHGKDYGCQGY